MKPRELIAYLQGLPPEVMDYEMLLLHEPLEKEDLRILYDAQEIVIY